MRTNEESQIEIEAPAIINAQAADRAAHKIAGQALLAQEAIRTMRPIAETALGNDLLLALGGQINAGAFKILNQTVGQILATFQNGFNCTPDQARMCLMYAILFPEKAQPQPPRLATRQERRALDRGKKDRNG